MKKVEIEKQTFSCALSLSDPSANQEFISFLRKQTQGYATVLIPITLVLGLLVTITMNIMQLEGEQRLEAL